MKRVIFAVVMMLSGMPVFAQDINNLLKNYLLIRDALVSDDSKAASDATGRFYTALKNEPEFPEKGKLLAATEKLRKASGLDGQRGAFNDFSVHVWKVVKDAGKLSQPVYYQYCPMKKTYWVSEEKEIKNPYYGASMLTCGKVIETKN